MMLFMNMNMYVKNVIFKCIHHDTAVFMDSLDLAILIYTPRAKMEKFVRSICELLRADNMGIHQWMSYRVTPQSFHVRYPAS